MMQNVVDDVACSTRGHRHRNSAKVITSYRDNFVNGPYVSHQFHVFLFFFLCYNERIDPELLLFTHHFQNVTSGNPTERVKTVLRKENAMSGRNRLPGSPMKRHGVGER